MAEANMENLDELNYGKEETSEVNETSEYIVTTRLNLRKEPSTNSTIIKVLNENEKILVTGFDGDWAITKEGYCMKKYLKEG